jgi:uncharacterized membrane protein YqaE (UPF0057 family)
MELKHVGMRLNCHELARRYRSRRTTDGVPMDLLRIVIAIVLPPLGVFLQVGFKGAFWLNIVLTLLGYVPGLVHAIWIIAKR